jgi:WD40 repeat protein
MKQIGYRIILTMFILSGQLLLCGTVIPDRENKSVVSLQQKDRSTIITEICRKFRTRLAKQSPANLYRLPNAILASIIDFTGNKWRLWSTKQLFSVPRTIVSYGDNSIVIAQKQGIKIVNLTDIDVHCKEYSCSEIRIAPIAMLPDGRVAIAPRDNRGGYTINIWNVNSNVIEQRLKRHCSRVYALVVLPDNRLASASDDDLLIIWDLSSGAPILVRLTTHYQTSLLAMPDNILIIGRSDPIKPIELLDCVTGDRIGFVIDSQGVSCLARLSDTLFVSGSYKKLISGACSSPINVWLKKKAERVTLVRNLKGHTGTINALIVLPNDELASASDDGTIRIWNYETGDCLSILNNHTNRIHSLVAIPDGSLLSTSGEKTLKIWKKQRDCAYY